ncbi:hypothetical protein BDC45DRAFT_531370 [Circinella umbellata]|nr:hypothetical protein BDC45DRAFT_531370 [Circinella umbellata]
MEEVAVKKERESEYNKYEEKDTLLYLFLVVEKRMTNSASAKACERQRTYCLKMEEKPVEMMGHKGHLINFFDENKRVTITDTVDNLTKNFADLDIKKYRVAEFIKQECNLSVKVISRHPATRNSPAVIEKRAVWSGFDINMTRSRGWLKRGKPAIVETPSGRAISYTV